jgi:hypothetical protein
MRPATAANRREQRGSQDPAAVCADPREAFGFAVEDGPVDLLANSAGGRPLRTGHSLSRHSRGGVNSGPTSATGC